MNERRQLDEHRARRSARGRGARAMCRSARWSCSTTAIVGRGRNRRELDRDPTAHAEVVALRDAAQRARALARRGDARTSPRSRVRCARARSSTRGSPGSCTAAPIRRPARSRRCSSSSRDPRLNHRVEVTAAFAPRSAPRAAAAVLRRAAPRSELFNDKFLEGCPSGRWCLIRNQMCASTGGSNPSPSANF